MLVQEANTRIFQYLESHRKRFPQQVSLDVASNLEIEMKSMLEYMVEDDEEYGSGEPSRVEEDDTRDPSSQSIDITTSPSIDTSIS